MDNILLPIAKEILAANPGCLLSGSIALVLQNYKVRREPKDVDIYLPFKQDVKMVPGMLPIESPDDAHYDDEYYERLSYKYKGVNIDFFTPVNERITAPWSSSYHTIECIEWFDILKLKVMHAMGNHWTRYKHRDDIIHLLINES